MRSTNGLVPTRETDAGHTPSDWIPIPLMEQIEDILRKANLSLYVAPLLEVGADDVDQLVSLPEQDFQSLIEMIGMAKKPFHVMRFKKAINRTNTNPLGACSGSNNTAGIDHTTHTVTVYATQIDDPNSIGNNVSSLHHNKLPCLPTITPATTVPLPQVPPPVVVSSLTNSNSGHQQTTSTIGYNTNFFELMSSTAGGPITSSSSPGGNLSFRLTAQHLQSLVDETMVTQSNLGPSPISPEIWDNGRKEIFRKSSILFSNSISPLTEQERLMNEAAYQLCMWDPTLLVRQKDLFDLSKKFLKHYTPTSMDIDHPNYMLHDNSNSTGGNPLPAVQRGPDGKFRSCFEENYERRELQIQQIELLIAENASKEKMKQALLLQAKEKMDYSLALKIQEELSVLGKTQREYKTEMSRLRKVQRRSIRHQELKKLKKNNDSGGSHHELHVSTPNMTSTMNTVSLDSGVTVVSEPLIDTSPPSDQADNLPLQLHTYIHDNTPTVVSSSHCHSNMSTVSLDTGVPSRPTDLLDTSPPSDQADNLPLQLHTYIHHDNTHTIARSSPPLNIPELDPVLTDTRSSNYNT